MADVIDLGKYGPAFTEDPHPVYAELRALDRSTGAAATSTRTTRPG